MLKVDRLEEAKEKLLFFVSETGLKTETVPVCESYGRILAEDMICGEDIPGFPRSTVDGYAVRVSDTGGAS